MDEMAFLNDAAANAVDPGALMARALIRHNYHFFLAANVALNAPDRVGSIDGRGGNAYGVGEDTRASNMHTFANSVELLMSLSPNWIRDRRIPYLIIVKF